MTTQPTWSDVPPSENGWYWIRYQGHEQISYFNGELDPDDEFGPRVLSAEETVKLTAEFERLRAEVATLRGAMAAQDERERVAGERCGVSREQHGCDWPEWGADEVLRLRAENAELRALIENNNAVADMCGLDLPKSL